MDLLRKDPEIVVDAAEASEIIVELRTASLSPEVAPRVDHILRQWTLRALAKPADTEGLLELDEAAVLATRALTDDSQNAVYRTRWRAFRDLLESKRLAITGRESRRASRILHVDRVLGMLGNGERTQSDIQRTLALSAQRVSQVLNVMEEAGFIVREKRGKEKVVSLVGADTARAKTTSTGPSLGATVWAGQKSA